MKRIYLLLLTLTISLPGFSDTGMWVPALLNSRIKDMKANGSKLSAEDIYSINQASLKDAVVLFGGGCTGEVISDQGLMLTNHHCGYYFIGSHSSVEKDYLTNGFWAMNRAQEIPNPGLSVSFLIRMDDVTAQVLDGVNDTTPSPERDSTIARNIRTIIQEATQGNHYQAAVEPFYYGNQYFLFLSEKFTDVRLVGAPPSAIGKFGGDTDNWMWPRHTGDFAMFRIYANANNEPADYAKENVPYRPRRSLTISTKPLKEGDFAMVYGNPGRTVQYVTSDAVDYTLNRSNPHKIRLRTQRLEIMNREQAKDPAVRIAYAAQNARVANPWKKWQGESKGLARLGTMEKKRAVEAQFTAWAADKPLYKEVLPRLRALYDSLAPYAYAQDFYQEVYEALDLPTFAHNSLQNIYSSTAAEGAGRFTNYSYTIDYLTTKALLAEYLTHVPATWTPAYLLESVARAGSVDAYVDTLFTQSAFSTREKYLELVALDSTQKAARLASDPALLLRNAFTEYYNDCVVGPYKSLNTEITKQYRLYMRGLMEMQPHRAFFPDANRTLRVAYGKIQGYHPYDGAYYIPFTTLEGIMEKDNPEIYDYNIPQCLREVYATKDYGPWAVNGSVPVAFLATNHTTGGNSGSPVLNARGELIGINFDRTWESTMSDYEFDPAKCRNIAVDIRYVLFVMDKVGGAGYLLEEMRFGK